MKITMYLEDQSFLENLEILNYVFKRDNEYLSSKTAKPVRLFTYSNDPNINYPVTIQLTLKELNLIKNYNINFDNISCFGKNI